MTLEDRLQLLDAHGHGWMDPQVSVALAQSGTPDNRLLQIADGLRAGVSNTWDGVSHFFDDPVLQKTPTSGLALHRYLTSAIGPLPVQDTDVQHLQEQLKAAGHDVRTDGIWDQASNAALNEQAKRHVEDQLAGNKPGSITVGHALHGLLHSLMPVGAAEHVIGFAKSIPGDVRQVVADASGLQHTIGQGIVEEIKHPLQFGRNVETARQAGRQADLATQRVYWNHNITAEDIQSQTTGINILGRFVGDVGTVFLLSGVGGAAKGIAQAAGEMALGGFSRDLTAQEAMRGPGVIAKSLSAGKLTTRVAGGAAVGGTVGGVTAAAQGDNIGKGIASGALIGGATGALIPGRAFNNLPVLKHTGPIIGKLADADGLYYKTRTRLAVPYQYKSVQGAGQLMGQVQLQGLKVGAVTGLQGVLGQDQTDLNQNVAHTTFLDTINDSIAAHTQVPGFGGKFHADLNDLMFFLHAPMTGPNRLSQQADNEGDRLATGFVSAAGGHTDAIAQFERALGTNHQDLVNEAGGNVHALNAWMSHKIRTFAAYRYADQTINQMGFDGTLPTAGSEVQDLKRALASKVWNDPDLMAKATNDILADRQHYIETGLKNELALSKSDPKDFMRHELGQFLDAGEIMTRQILPNSKALLHPGTFEALDTARAETEFSNAMVMPPPRRADYVARFNSLRKRVQQGIIDTEPLLRKADERAVKAKAAFQSEQAAGQVSEKTRQEYRAAVNARTQLGKRSEAMQAALDNGSGDLITYANHADQTGTGAYLKPDYQQWQDAAHQLRNMIDPAIEGDYSLRDMLNGKYNPHQMFDRQFGNRTQAIPQPKMAWLSDNNPDVAQGALGLARTDTLTAQDARRAHDLFDTRLNTPGSDVQQINADMRDFAFHEFGWDARKLAVFTTPQKLLDAIDQQSKALASDVFLAPDAPASVQNAVTALADKGYKIVHGTDIGHMYAGTYGDVSKLGAALNRRQRLAGAVGTSPIRYSAVDHAADLRLRVATAIRQKADQGKIRLPAHYTAQTILSDLRDNKILEKQMPWLENAIFSVTRGLHAQDIKIVMEKEGISQGEAENRVKDNIIQSLGLRDISRKDVLARLTRPDEITGLPMMDKGSANEVFKAILTAYTNRPTYMTGLPHLEDLARNALWKYADKVGVRGTNDATALLLNLPNNLARLRDRYRFTLSPYFSFRRIAKTNVKMGMEGVTPTANPTKTLIDNREFDKANKTLDRILGNEDSRNRWLDESDRYLHSQDIFGLYNARRFEAHFVNELSKQGKTDDEIRTALTKTFSYGGRYGEGRSALERTTNFIFFPFSFEKTLYRNVGHYLLDHPGQAMVLTGALRAYKDFNDHHLDGNDPRAASWYEQHLPLLQEVLRLNAFAHGISPGELGGINAPLLNAFMPQSWASSQDSSKTLKRFIPAVADLQRIMKEVPDQQHVVTQSFLNGVTIVRDRGQKQTALDMRPSNKTHDAQMTEAFDLRNKLIESLKPTLDFNAKHSQSKDQQYLWPAQEGIPAELHGQPVNKTSLGVLIHKFYPAFDPQGGQLYAVQKQAEAKAWLAKRYGTPQYKTYDEFVQMANTAANHLNTDDYPPEQARAVQGAFRQRAAELASHDPAFLAFYRKHYRSTFGPIERQN